MGGTMVVRIGKRVIKEAASASSTRFRTPESLEDDRHNSSTVYLFPLQHTLFIPSVSEAQIKLLMSKYLPFEAPIL